MMLIATTVASVLIASITSAAGAPAASSPAVPPMIVNVSAPGISPQLVKAVLAETDAIWRSSGVTFVWRNAPAAAASPARAGVDAIVTSVPNTLRLTIGESRGASREGYLPLGWILFNDGTVPEQEIYLSYANARAMMEEARGVVGIINEMPLAQRETLLARAMGRAFAHELGHYLLASKMHTPRGLMKAVLTAVELFMPDTSAFRIEPAQRRAVAARLRGEAVVAMR
jgi:hypothetical protein